MISLDWLENKLDNIYEDLPFYPLKELATLRLNGNLIFGFVYDQDWNEQKNHTYQWLSVSAEIISWLKAQESFGINVDPGYYSAVWSYLDQVDYTL